MRDAVKLTFWTLIWTMGNFSEVWPIEDLEVASFETQDGDFSRDYGASLASIEEIQLESSHVSQMSCKI